MCYWISCPSFPSPGQVLSKGVGTEATVLLWASLGLASLPGVPLQLSPARFLTDGHWSQGKTWATLCRVDFTCPVIPNEEIKLPTRMCTANRWMRQKAQCSGNACASPLRVTSDKEGKQFKHTSRNPLTSCKPHPLPDGFQPGSTHQRVIVLCIRWPNLALTQQRRSNDYPFP